MLWLGTRLWSRRAGLLGGLILLTTVGFSAFGRSASPDMPFTTCCTLAFSLLAVAAVQDTLKSWQVRCAYVFLGLAVLAKGPVALVLAAGILLGFWVLDEQGGCLGRMRVGSGALVAVLGGSALVLARIQRKRFLFHCRFFSSITTWLAM